MHDYNQFCTTIYIEYELAKFLSLAFLRGGVHSNLGLVYRYSRTSMLGNDKSVIYKLWHSIIVMIYTKSKMTTSLKITDCNLETPYKANYKIWHAFFIPFAFICRVRSSYLEITYKILFIELILNCLLSKFS